MVATIRKCLRLLPPAIRRRWLLLAPLALVTSAVEAGAASAIFVLLAMLSDPARALAIPWVSALVAHFPSREPNAIILVLTGLLAAYSIGKSVLLLGSQYLRHRIARGSSAYLAAEMLRRYLAAPYPFHFQHNSAELIRNCQPAVIDVVGGVVGASFSAATDALMIASLGIVLIATNPGPAIPSAVGLILLMVLVLRLTRHAAARLGQQTHTLAASMIQSLQQALGGIKEVKVLGREQFFYQDFVDRQRQLLGAGYLGITLDNAPTIIVQTVLLCGGLGLIAFLTAFGVGGIRTIPIAGVFGYAGTRILPMVNSIILTINGIRSAQAAVDELHEHFVNLEDGGAFERGEQRYLTFDESIVLTQVSYSYPGAGTPAIANVNLTITRGESVGIVGATGAGKSTLVDVILGLLPATRGSVTVDGVDLGHGAAPWKRRVGYVPQTPFLTDDTLRRNIALGISDHDIDDERLRSVLPMAQLVSFIDPLPEGLDTLVGERGIRISGGERQRIAIARALYHDPDLLVFDEATASLDVATETEITRAIDALHGVKTMIVVAHRLSTVRRCDRIIWLNRGTVAGLGSFDALRERHPEFRRISELASLS